MKSYKESYKEDEDTLNNENENENKNEESGDKTKNIQINKNALDGENIVEE